MNRTEIAKRNAHILELFDAGHRTCEITKRLGFPKWWTVNNVLQTYRPDRVRRWVSSSRVAGAQSCVPAIKNLAAMGMRQCEIARLLNVSRQHVSAVLRD